MALPVIGFLLRISSSARTLISAMRGAGSVSGMPSSSRLLRLLDNLLQDHQQQISIPRLKITTNFPDVIRGLNRLHDDIRWRALPRALNKMAELARTEARRQITAMYAMRATDVRARLKIKRARPDENVAVLYVDSRGGRGGRSLNVARFVVGGGGKGSRMTKASARRALKAGARAPLKVRIKKGIVKSMGPVFLANAGKTAFRRVGDKRFPIEPVQTIDVQQMFNERSINESIRSFIERRWPNVMEREMDHFIRQWERS
jgi:hypothetical protein